MQTISKHSYSFSAGMILGPTMPKYEGGHRQVDWARLKEYIETNKSEIEKVDVGLAEDWDCTSGTVFKNEDYCKSGSVYGQSDWATPAFEVTHVDGSVQMYECWKLGDDAYEYFDLDLPQAPETTEILNEVKADKGILTEEELKVIIGLVEYDVEEGNNIFWGHAKLLLEEINRLKELELSYLSANAELSFKNMKFKQAVEEVRKYLLVDGDAIKTLDEALEDLK